MNKKVLITAIITTCTCLLVILGVVIAVNSNSIGERKPYNSSSEPKNLSSEGGSNQVSADAGEELPAGKDFLKDQAFLDEFQPFSSAGSETEDGEKVYSLLVSSVKNDIRITVLDRFSRVVEGIPFTVKIKDTGEYKDIDYDGIIYVGGLKAGKYEVELAGTKEYRGDSSVTINVHDSLEYNELKDISYLIKTEDEIDALAEDTFASTADMDASEKKELWKERSDAALGIDVSKWNKSIDWKLVHDSGVEFAIIRCGYRGSKTGALVEDPYFYTNLLGAKEAGIKVGVYFFTQALNETEAVEEASTVLSLLNGEKLDYPIFIDTESSGGRADGLDVDTRTAVCDAFCKTIEKNGYTAGVYASRNWFYKKVNDDKLSLYVRWLAEYREIPLYTGKYEIWQYTSSGSVPGIEGRVDLNQSYRDF